MDKDVLFSLLQKIGIQELKQRGGDIGGRCPSGLHADRRPSWGISLTEPHKHGCFTCNFKGVLQSLLVQVGKYNPVQAKIICGTLQERSGVDVSDLRNAMAPRKKESKFYDEDEMYPFPLTDRAISYFAKRGIKRLTLESARIGYDKKEDRVLYPWYREGKIVAIVGRYIGKEEEPSKVKNYILGQNKRLNVYLPARRFYQSELIIVEGEADALKVYQAKFHNVCAIGSASVVEEQIKLMLNSGAERFRIFTDDDGPGQKIAHELEEHLSKHGPTSLVDYSPVRKLLNVKVGKLDPAMLSVAHIQLLLDQGASFFPKMGRL